MLTLMYITNSPDVARIADRAGVDRIFIDLEQYGKQKRQADWDSVKSKHSIEDIPKVKAVLKNAQLLVRTDPVFDGLGEEIEGVLRYSPDVIMLPYFKTVEEVEKFLSMVGGRAKTSLLVETKEAEEKLDEILSLGGIDEIHIGLNDLSHSHGKQFLFEELADGTVDEIVGRIKAHGIDRFGIGGITALGKGLLPCERIIPEHYRLGSTCAILSRDFCDTAKVTNLEEIDEIFTCGVRALREFEMQCQKMSTDAISENLQELRRTVREIVGNMSN